MSKRITCLQKQFWINKGLSEEDAIAKISEIQKNNSKKLKKENRFSPRKKDDWIKQGLSEEEALNVIKSMSNICKEYWTKRGLSEEEAILKITEVQSKNSKKRKEYKSEDQNTNIKYYIKRGFDNALEALNERQNTRSLQKYVEKYGEEKGLKKYKKTIEQFKQTSWYSKTKEEQIELTLKRTKNSNFYSKSSILFFESLIKDLNLPYKIRWKNNEHFIKHDEGIVFYDFCIPDLKIIIEFNGVKFHPNKNKLSKESFDQWRQLLSKQPADEIYKKDMFKIQLANDNGYDLFTVWEDDIFEDKINQLKEEIIKRIKKS